MNIDCVLIKWNDEAKTNFTVINWNAVITSPDVVGLDSNLEYCVKRTPFAVPDFDTRLTKLVTTQGLGENDETYPQLKQWVIAYSLTDRTEAEKLVSVDDSENDANYQVFPTSKQMKYIVLALAIIDRKSSGLIISPEQQLILDKLQAKAQKIWSNHITATAKKTAIDNTEQVDLDTDWELTDPENEA